MTDRPILFSAPMVRAILAGVTRLHATGQIVKRPGFPAPCINDAREGRLD